ncbi:MAG: hypothetical protein ACP5QR_05940 [Rhizomicrobium sp.]
MIVWSRGLGKQRLPLELADATLKVEPAQLMMEGTIEPVCWRYAIRLSPDDLRDFLALMAKPEVARFLAERPGVLLPFVGRLLLALPGLVLDIIYQKTVGRFHRKQAAS